MSRETNAKKGGRCFGKRIENKTLQLKLYIYFIKHMSFHIKCSHTNLQEREIISFLANGSQVSLLRGYTVFMVRAQIP